jgi:hypothetical protein
MLGCSNKHTVLQTETQVIAIEEELSQPCTIRVYPGGTSKEAITGEYIRALGVIGKCELQRSETLLLTKELKELYKQ